jgi:hypothetical protein
MNANGTSRINVIPSPRYNPPSIDEPTARPSRSAKTVRTVDDRDDEPNALVCIFDLITSVGTRIKHAAHSPIEAEIICVGAAAAEQLLSPR